MPVQTQMQVRRGTASSWTSTNPTLAAGELGFETDTGKFKIGTGSSTWTALPYAGGGQNTLTTYQYTATAGQTTFSGADINSNTLSYTAGAVQVYLNGALLQNTVDYAASTGTSVVLTAGAGLGDSLTILSLGSFTVSTDIPKSTLTAKGSIIAASGASTPANLSVGANDTVLTADSTTATGLKWATPSSGAVVQVKSATTSTAVTTTGSTMIDTGLSVSITPTSASNKILVLLTQQMAADSSAAIPEPAINLELFRGATSIWNGGGQYGFYFFKNASGTTDVRIIISATYLDSPATTSATTYKTQFARGAANVTAKVQAQSSTSTITVMEVTP